MADRDSNSSLPRFGGGLALTGRWGHRSCLPLASLTSPFLRCSFSKTAVLEKRQELAFLLMSEPDVGWVRSPPETFSGPTAPVPGVGLSAEAQAAAPEPQIE